MPSFVRIAHRITRFESAQCNVVWSLNEPRTANSANFRARKANFSLQNVHNRTPFSQNVWMNKRDLAKSVAVQADVDLKTVSAVLDGFTDVVTAVVSKGEPVSIPGFAKFVKVDRAARMGRNPATGETIRIKASKKARITPVKAFKDAVLAPATAPKLNKGAWPIDAAAVAAAGKVAAVAPARASVAKAPAKKATGARKAPVTKKVVRRAAPAKKAPAAKKVVRRAAPAKKAPVAKKVVRRAPAKKAVKRAR
jgi:DNA-binding protein HU-beta